MNVKLRERKLSKGVKRYYLDIYIDGTRYYDFLDVKIYPNDTKEVKNEKKTIAELIRSNKEVELLTNQTKYVPKHFKNVNFFDFADDFIERYQKKDVRMLDATLKKFKEYVKNDNLRISDISTSLMTGYKDFLNDRSNLKGETPHNYFTRFKKILKEAELKGILKDNPTANIKFQKRVSNDVLKKQVLITEEIQTLVNTKCGNSEVKKAFLFACYSGLGLAEINQLTWENIVKDKLVTKREKTDQKVELKLKAEILNLLGDKKSKKTPIFNLRNENGEFLSTNAINKCIKNWVSRAKIEKHITFYCARHTFATQLLQYKANLKTVADVMGHSSTRSTIKYLNYIDNLKEEAIDNLPVLKF